MRSFSTFSTALVALVALVAAAAAGGATSHAVALTATGPQPAQITVKWGDSVVFSNSDSVAHTLLIPRLSLTVELPPGGSHTQPFSGRRGTYPFRERIGNRAVEGVVTVEVSGTLGLKATPSSLTYGRPLTVAGTSPFAASPVALLFRTHGSGTWSPLRTVIPSASGAFSTSVPATKGGALMATAAEGQLRSSPVTFLVKPTLTVRPASQRVKAGSPVRLSVRVRPGGSVSSATLERFDAERKRWMRASTGRIAKSGLGTLSVPAEKGANRLRVLVPRSALTPGYEDVASKTVTVTGV
jgi:plastocyanin